MVWFGMVVWKNNLRDAFHAQGMMVSPNENVGNDLCSLHFNTEVFGSEVKQINGNSHKALLNEIILFTL